MKQQQTAGWHAPNQAATTVARAVAGEGGAAGTAGRNGEAKVLFTPDKPFPHAWRKAPPFALPVFVVGLRIEVLANRGGSGVKSSAADPDLSERHMPLMCSQHATRSKGSDRQGALGDQVPCR